MSEKELNIAEAMNLILNGQAKTASVEALAMTKIVEAANILHQTGFEEEAQQVFATLSAPLTKEASTKVEEEILFEITSDNALS